jgi:hypothetical protein
MPSKKLDRREQGAEVERHLAAAAEDIAIAEAGDSRRTAYERAADHIIAAQEVDPALSLREIDRRLRRGSKGGYAGGLLQWRREGREGLPFSDVAAGRDRDAVGTRRLARERPDDFAEAFEQAPADAKRQIAEQISKAPEVRAEARKRDHEEEQRRRPSPVPPRTDHMLYQVEGKQATAERALRECIALINELDQPGDDEDVIERFDRIEQLAQAAREGYTTGKSIDTWAMELWEERRAG